VEKATATSPRHSLRERRPSPEGEGNCASPRHALTRPNRPPSPGGEGFVASAFELSRRGELGQEGTLSDRSGQIVANRFAARVAVVECRMGVGVWMRDELRTQKCCSTNRKIAKRTHGVNMPQTRQQSELARVRSRPIGVRSELAANIEIPKRTQDSKPLQVRSGHGFSEIGTRSVGVRCPARCTPRRCNR
jgi:hypothetical protein